MANIETYDEIFLDFLTKNGVSVLKKTYADINGQIVQIGANFRTAYSNSPSGRIAIVNDLPEQYATAVLMVWGDAPTVNDPTLPIIINND